MSLAHEMILNGTQQSLMLLKRFLPRLVPGVTSHDMEAAAGSHSRDRCNIPAALPTPDLVRRSSSEGIYDPEFVSNRRREIEQLR